MNRLFIPVFMALAFFGTSCNNCGECFTPPEGLSLRVFDSHDSTDLIFTGVYFPDSITIYYLESEKAIVVDSEVSVDSSSMSAYIFSNEIGWKSVENHKHFLLELSENNTDTIYFDVRSITENCCTYHSIFDFTINEKEPQLNKNKWYYCYFK